MDIQVYKDPDGFLFVQKGEQMKGFDYLEPAERDAHLRKIRYRPVYGTEVVDGNRRIVEIGPSRYAMTEDERRKISEQVIQRGEFAGKTLAQRDAERAKRAEAAA